MQHFIAPKGQLLVGRLVHLEAITAEWAQFRLIFPRLPGLASERARTTPHAPWRSYYAASEDTLRQAVAMYRNDFGLASASERAACATCPRAVAPLHVTS